MIIYKQFLSKQSYIHIKGSFSATQGRKNVSHSTFNSTKQYGPRREVCSYTAEADEGSADGSNSTNRGRLMAVWPLEVIALVHITRKCCPFRASFVPRQAVSFHMALA